MTKRAPELEPRLFLKAVADRGPLNLPQEHRNIRGRTIRVPELSPARTFKWEHWVNSGWVTIIALRCKT